MKILTVHGSQDSDGNSARLLKARLEGIGQAGGVQKKRNGRLLDGRTWNGMPKGRALELELR